MKLLVTIILFLLLFSHLGGPVAYASEKEAIVVPYTTDSILINGDNYYTESHLSQATTQTLLFISLMLFFAGFGVLKLPDFLRSVKEVKPFAIPYLGDVNSLI